MVWVGREKWVKKLKISIDDRVHFTDINCGPRGRPPKSHLNCTTARRPLEGGAVPQTGPQVHPAAAAPHEVSTLPYYSAIYLI